MPNKPEFTLDQIIAQLDSGNRWTGGQVTYSFASKIPDGGFPGGENTGLALFTGSQRGATRLALSLWEDLANITILEKPEEQADILFTNYNDAGQAYAYLPLNGDVFVNPRQSSNLDVAPSGYGLNTLIHEAGHALGLEHPGDYDQTRSDNLDYRNEAEYAQDTRQFTIMSYWDATNFGTADHANVYPSTPMVHDVAAIQAIYGVNTDTRSGDTVYGFNSTADSTVFNFASRAYKIAPVLTIWDAGGTDTLDLSGYDTPSRVDLNDGAYSDVGGLTANIGIAFNAFVENVIGGNGNDQLTGQELDNVLNGGAGDDILAGGDGNDTLIGGEGTDIAVFTGAPTDYSVSTVSETTFRVTGNETINEITGVEFLRFDSGVTVSLEDFIRDNGVTAASTPVGNDTARPDEGNDDVDTGNGSDASNTFSGATSITLPVAVTQTVGGTDTFDYYQFTAASNGSVRLDLSGLEADLDLAVYNADETRIDISDLGGTNNETLEFVVTSGQTYFVEIYSFSGTVSSYNLAGTLTPPDPGDGGETIANALPLSIPITINQSVGSTIDETDFFSFVPTSDGLLTLNLTQHTADLDLYLYGGDRSTIATSESFGTSDENISFEVTGGQTYYIEVFPFLSAESDYQLDINFGLISSETTADAENLSLPGSVNNSVGGTDSIDYYRIQPTTGGQLRASLTGLTDDIDLVLISETGDTLVGSYVVGTGDEQIRFDVEVGETYFLAVAPYLTAQSDYSLTTSVVQRATTDGGNTLGNALSIALDTTRLESVGGEEDTDDYFTFTASAYGELTVNLTDLEADIDLRLLDGNGNSLLSSTGFSTSNEEIVYAVTAGSTYSIHVDPFLDAQSDYLLNAILDTSVTIVQDGNESTATAEAISTSQTINSSVGNIGDDNDYYRLTASSNGEVEISLSGLSEDVDLRLLDENGDTLSSSTSAGSNSEQLFFNLSAGSTYFIQVDPYRDAISDYTLTTALFAESVSDAADTRLGADLITLPSAITQTVGTSSDSDDYFRFQATANGEIHLTLTGLSDDIDLRLLDTIGESLASSTAGGSSSEEIFFNVVQGNTYYVHVDPFLSSFSNYTLNAAFEEVAAPDGNDTIATASSITLPTTLTQNVGSGNDTDDFYGFTATENGTVTVQMTGLQSDIDLALVDANDVRLTSSLNSGASDESFAYFVTAGETYYINVYPFLDNESTYSLNVTFDNSTSAQDASDTFQSAATLTAGENVIQDVGAGADNIDYYRFTPTSSGELTLSLDDLSDDLDLYVFDSTQTEIAGSFLAGANGETINLSVTAGETYFVSVEPYLSAQSSYTLQATIVDPLVPELIAYTDGISDLVEYDGTFSNDLVSYDEATGTTTVSGPVGQGTFSNIDRVVFSDGTLIVDRSDQAFDVYRMSEAVLNRAPTTDELSFLVRLSDLGISNTAIMEELRKSSKFSETYGRNVSDSDLADGYYRTVLGRAPTSAEQSDWDAQLAAGTSVSAIMVGIANGAENVARVEGLIDDGLWIM